MHIMGVETQKHRPITISEGKTILRDFQSTAGKRHARVHENELDDASNRLRALNGLCGSCSCLRVFSFLEKDRDKTRVVLRCTANESPVDLYRRTELGDKANCLEFKEK